MALLVEWSALTLRMSDVKLPSKVNVTTDRAGMVMLVVESGVSDSLLSRESVWVRSVTYLRTTAACVLNFTYCADVLLLTKTATMRLASGETKAVAISLLMSSRLLPSLKAMRV